MNIEPSRKIESSFRLISKGSWGSGIMGMAVAMGKLEDLAARRRFNAVQSLESVSRAPFHRSLFNTSWSWSTASCFAAFQS